MKRLSRKTKRLVVRPLEAKDFEAWKTAHETMRKRRNTWDIGANSPDQLTKAKFKKMLAHRKKQMSDDYFYSLAVFDKSGNFVGSVSIMEVVRGLSHSAYLGWRTFNQYWGKGYGTEAVEALIDIAFRDLKLHRVEAGIEPGNRRSTRLAISLGLRREGVKRRALFLRGDWIDLKMYSATCDEFGFKFKGTPKPLHK